MKGFSSLLAVVLVLLCSTTALAGTQEDLEFARKMFDRKWYDWAMETAKDLVEDSRTSQFVRGWAAELEVAILNERAKFEEDGDALRQKAEALTAKYQRMFPDHEAWGAAAVFALLQRRLETAQDLAKKAEVEPNKDKCAQLTGQAVKIFEEVGSKWEELIKKFRLEVAHYPPEHKWGQWARDKTPKEQNKLLDKVWKRNLAEYLYASSFIFYAKVVSKEKKSEIIQKGLKKFMRFIDGDAEHPGDCDPMPAIPKDERPASWDPEPRMTFIMLIYLAEIGVGQCHIELGQYEKAIEHFDYMVQAELPRNHEGRLEATTPEGKEKEINGRMADIKRIVDIRLQAYYLEGFAYNLAKKHEDAERILTELLNQSGKEVQPNRPLVKKFWEYFKHPEMAFMPNVREKFYGKLASLELAKALTAQGRYSEGIDECYKVFAIEQASRTGGQVSPFEVNAAKTMAELSKQVSTVKFPIGAAFAVARGFQYQEQWDDAIIAFKKVYGSPGSPDEIREYAPKALFELGKMLYSNGRYLEAAIALAEVCEQFQDFAQIGQAANLMKQAFRKVQENAEASGKAGKAEGDWVEYSKKLYKDTLPATLEPIKDMMRQALAYAGKGNFKLAAETYDDVPKTFQDTATGGETVTKPNPYYAAARAQLGYCTYRLHDKHVKTNPEEALKVLKKAAEILEDALNIAAAEENKNAEITALYYLAKCYTTDLWKDKEAKEKAKKALEYMAPFKGKHKDNKNAQKYLPDVLATMARAHYKLSNYGKMHSAFQELEKRFNATRDAKEKERTGSILKDTAITLHEMMKKQGDKMATAVPDIAAQHYEEAAYYVYAWFKASGDNLKPQDLLWAGGALCDCNAFDKAAEVLKKYFDKLPREGRTRKQKQQATHAKILLAQARYGMGDYEGAAGLFDILRRTVGCENRNKPGEECDYEKVIPSEDFDKPMGTCPDCKKRRNQDVKLVKVHDSDLRIQEGAAKSYLAIYEKAGKKDMVALNKSQDVYQRILKRLEGHTKEELRYKYWEIAYTILKIYYYKREFRQIVGQLKTLILLSSDQSNPDNPTDDDWKRAVPLQPWRDKIRELFELALKAGKGS